MGRCNSLLYKGISLNTIDKDNDKVSFVAIEDDDSCYKIKARKFINSNNTAVEINERPADKIQCNPMGCTTSKSVKATGDLEYFGAFDGNDIRAGVLTFYTKGTGTITVTISSDKDFTNAISYTKTLSGGNDFSLNLVDFIHDDATQIGEGWTASDRGVYIKFSMNSEYTLSTISFYEDMEDFASTRLITLTCLSDLSQTLDYSVMEETCTTGGYDTSSDPTVEMSITAQAVSPDYRYLNPSYKLVEKGAAIKSSRQLQVKRTIKNGVINIADMDSETCGRLGANIASDCNKTEGLLNFLNIQQEIYLEKMQFNVTFDDEGIATLHFNEALEGEELIIEYPQKIEVQRMAANPKNIGKRRYQMIYNHYQSDKEEYIYTGNKVYITSFPNSIGSSDNTFEFTVAFQKDENGDWFTIDRVVD